MTDEETIQKLLDLKLTTMAQAFRDLLAEIRRGIDQEPSFAIAAHGERCLGSRRRPRVAGTRTAARFRVRIPLRESTAGRGPEDDGLHAAIERLSGREGQRSAQA